MKSQKVKTQEQPLTNSYRPPLRKGWNKKFENEREQRIEAEKEIKRLAEEQKLKEESLSEQQL